MEQTAGTWGPPMAGPPPATWAPPVADAGPPPPLSEPPRRGKALRRIGVLAAVLASFGIGRASVQSHDEEAAAPEPTTVAELTIETAALAEPTTAAAPATEAVPVTTVAPTTTQATTTTVAVTGDHESCDEFWMLDDADGDGWGECRVDGDAAHGRAQTIVAYLGFTELTCNTDPSVGSTACDVLAPNGAVHRVTIAINGDLLSDVITQEAPFDRAQCTAQPPAGVLQKDPDSFTGQCLHMYGYITQYDTATGRCGFRADISNLRSKNWYDYDVNTILVADEPCPFLDPIISGDIVEMWFTSTGSFSYDTTIGGTATAVSGTLEDAALIAHG